MRDITYCLSCKKDTRNIDAREVKTKNNKRVMSSKCSICNNKKSKFISQGSGLFDSLGLNTPQNRMKNALWNTFGYKNYVQSTSASSTYKYEQHN